MFTFYDFVHFYVFFLLVAAIETKADLYGRASSVVSSVTEIEP